MLTRSKDAEVWREEIADVTGGCGSADRRRDGVPPRLWHRDGKGRIYEHHRSQGTTKQWLEGKENASEWVVHGGAELGGHGGSPRRELRAGPAGAARMAALDGDI
jgi:hypothetical protein